MVQKKVGRPTTNPKSVPIHVRFDVESEQILEKYCEQENVNKAEGIRRGIKKLKSDLK